VDKDKLAIAVGNDSLTGIGRCGGEEGNKCDTVCVVVVGGVVDGILGRLIYSKNIYIFSIKYITHLNHYHLPKQ
jgi:hypothetical protein